MDDCKTCVGAREGDDWTAPAGDTDGCTGCTVETAGGNDDCKTSVVAREGDNWTVLAGDDDNGCTVCVGVANNRVWIVDGKA